MKRFSALRVASCAVLAMLALPPIASAEAPADLFNPQIEINYVPPTNSAYTPIYERLKQRKVLETLRQFLAPIKYPQDAKLVVQFDQCGSAGRRYKPGEPVVVCYEYVDQIERLVPRSAVDLTQGRVTVESTKIGPVVQAALHEVAIASFHLLRIPVWGRLDDAADRVAAFIMLQFGPEVAWNTVVGSAWFLSGLATNSPDYSDVRGVIAQRYYNTLCVAIGAEQRKLVAFDSKRDARSFLNFVGNEGAGNLPLERARECVAEFDMLKDGFVNVVMPYIDTKAMEQVQKVNWIEFDTR